MGRSAKSGRSLNPADELRRKQHKKELKKNKIDRQKVRETGLLYKDTRKLEAEIDEYQALAARGRLAKDQKEKLIALAAQLDSIREARKAHGLDEQGRAPNPYADGKAVLGLANILGERTSKATTDPYAAPTSSADLSGEGSGSDSGSDSDESDVSDGFQIENLADDPAMVEAGTLQPERSNSPPSQPELTTSSPPSSRGPHSQYQPRPQASHHHPYPQPPTYYPGPMPPPPPPPFGMPLGPPPFPRPPFLPPFMGRPPFPGPFPPNMPPPPLPLHPTGRPLPFAPHVPHPRPLRPPRPNASEFRPPTPPKTPRQPDQEAGPQPTALRPPASATVLSAAPVVRDFQKELNAFIPPALRRLQRAERKKQQSQVSHPVVSSALPSPSATEKVGTETALTTLSAAPAVALSAPTLTALSPAYHPATTATATAQTNSHALTGPVGKPTPAASFGTFKPDQLLANLSQPSWLAQIKRGNPTAPRVLATKPTASPVPATAIVPVEPTTKAAAPSSSSSAALEYEKFMADIQDLI
ncbi:hypothetical protein IWQ60_000454 [Tieghemiomyces parasiticus]|uniref:Wbp11/ELF5/Saf1 N-terminal domain-containing protein n=1 Tax=Tieghemiomyces parasiticus TaxID=78921 RepID=A0A9W8AL49_9FUNG|nr:hypothetical protein IWQ60_000454 [Tieghemiomyces parasiticus]